MYPIIEKKILTPYVSLMRIFAPEVTKHALPGQFIMLRVTDEGERIPLTIADVNHEDQTITIIFQVAGATTYQLNQLKENESITDFVGPLGKPTDLSQVHKALVIGGGVGCAIAYPLVKALYQKKVVVDTIIGFRSQEFVFLSQEFKKVSRHLHLVTDDGSLGTKGFVTDVLRELLKVEDYDHIFCIGPLPMMKVVSMMTKEKKIKTIVSMNPIMIDGTGMCGGCRVTVDGKIYFACVDGPEFDGHLVDFDEAIVRSKMYQSFEKEAYPHRCKLKEGEKS